MKLRIFIAILSVVFPTCYGQEAVITPGLYTIIRSTTGVSGFSKTILTSKWSYIVNQSIGQSSVIGTFDKNGYTIRQGFQQPFLSARIVQPLPENNLKATIYPNPFRQSINVSFDDPITKDLFVIISDIMGRIIFSQKLPASQLINLPLDYIPNGIYVLKITAENKQFIANLIKQ